jgi:ATP-binding cassette subfamily B protein
MQLAAGSNAILAQLPRFLIEAIGIMILSFGSYLMIISGGDLVLVIPILGVTAMCAQKLLPVLQQAYAAFVTIKGSTDSVLDALSMLDNKIPLQKGLSSSTFLSFESSIILKDIAFSYPSDTQIILQKISLKINKGDKLGIIGTTGSGKSTLVDILMGLLKPISGTIEVDGQVLSDSNIGEWHSFISHVPQFIFLADGTIIENIAFGIEPHNIDMMRVYEAVEASQLSETINNLPDRYETFVGERGIRLSGGQRQRLGIARALYKRSKLLILDEATSALDSKTEELVINSIQKLCNEVTIILITHRATSLSICSRIAELSNGEIQIRNNKIYN